MVKILICIIFLAQAIQFTYIPSTKIPPSPRVYASSAYNEVLDIIFVFSGTVSTNELNDFWQFSVSLNEWDQIIPINGILPGNY